MLKKFVIMFLTGAVAVTALNSDAVALPEFKKAFDLKYVKKSKHESLKADFKKASCGTCHVGKKKTEKDQNEYGKELAKLIQGNAKKRKSEATKESKEKGAEVKKVILKELEAAFTKLEKMKRKDGKVYGELLKAGKLPVPLPPKDKKEEEKKEEAK